MRTARIPFCLCLLAAPAMPLTAAAQKYPEKPVRMIVAFPTGASHILAILVSEKLRDALGQGVVPDFRPGAGGNLANELAAKAAPDGYTLLLTSGSITLSPSLYPKLGYDTFRDFTPISNLASVPNVMVVHPSVPAKTLSELTKLARSMPGKLNYGSGGFGSGSQLGSELFMSLAKVKIVHVPYKGAAIAMTAMLSGEVDMVTSTVPATIPHVNAGRIRALAVMAPERVPALKNVPTTAEAGMPELVVMTWYGMFAPANVRPEVVERINGELGKILRAPDVVAQLNKVGLDPSPGTPAEFTKFVRAEYEKWARVIKAANIKSE
ncbi:MAG: Bug family tripartite tricarboxylate transporter substrate binding protein [Burkholderiales bacterium]